MLPPIHMEMKPHKRASGYPSIAERTYAIHSLKRGMEAFTQDPEIIRTDFLFYEVLNNRAVNDCEYVNNKLKRTKFLKRIAYGKSECFVYA